MIEDAVEIPVFLPEIFNLLDRVNDRRMMFTAETAADFRQRRMGQHLAQIHRDLAGHGDGF